jgi:MOSC domain-containing protein YiiM
MCKKLAARHNEPMMARWMLKSGNCGFLMRCLEPGLVQVGNEISLIESGAGGITIDEANRVMYRHRDDTEAILKVLAEPGLSQDWRYSLEHRL